MSPFVSESSDVAHTRALTAVTDLADGVLVFAAARALSRCPRCRPTTWHQRSLASTGSGASAMLTSVLEQAEAALSAIERAGR
jgi:hypothetical protein